MANYAGPYELLEQGRGQSWEKFDILGDLLRSKSARWTHIAPLLAVGLLSLVIAFQVTIIPVPIWLSGQDRFLSTTARTIYSTGITVLATLISAFAVGQIRTMWVVRLAEKKSPGPDRIRRAQVLLQIANIKTQIELYWLTTLLIILGLITTAIVGSTTITVKERWYLTSYVQFQGRALNSSEIGYNNSWQNSCWEPTTSPSTPLAWLNTTDGSYLAYNPLPGNFWCPIGIFHYYSGANDFLGDGYFNVFQDVCQHTVGGDIMCSALGASVAQSSLCSMYAAFGCKLGVTTRACVPTFLKPAVTCRSINSTSTGSGGIHLSGNTCNENTTALGSNGTSSTTNLTQLFCPHADAYGDMTFVLQTTDYTAAKFLDYLLTNETTFTGPTRAAECTLSLNSTLDYRIVTNTTFLAVDNSSTTSNSDGSINTRPAIQSTGEACQASDPKIQSSREGTFDNSLEIDQLLNLNARMMAATLLYMSINKSNLGTFLASAVPIVYGNGTIIFNRNAFNASENKLEDYLGVVVAASMSYYWGYYASEFLQVDPQDANQDDMVNYVKHTIYADRTGPGSWAALVYILPSAFSIAVILWLWSSARASGRNVSYQNQERNT